MEIIITAPTEGQYIQKIDFNYEELKQGIKASMEKYDNLFYTDEQMKVAKTDRANLNNFIKVMDSKRKEIKEKCLAPYTEFEAKIKELQKLVEGPVARIDNQIKTYENGKKAEKKTEIRRYYAENALEIADLIDFEQIFNERWLNTSVSLATVYKEIDTTIANIRDDFKAISALNSEFTMQIKDKYLQTLNLSAALQENERLTAQKAKIEQYEHTAPAVAQPIASKSPEPEQEKIVPAEAKLQQIDFRVWVTPEQKAAIRQFFISNNIKYGKVK